MPAIANKIKTINIILCLKIKKVLILSMMTMMKFLRLQSIVNGKTVIKKESIKLQVQEKNLENLSGFA